MTDQTAVLVAIVAAAAGLGGAGLGAWIAARETRRASVVAHAESEANRQDLRHARFAERKLALAVDLLLAADLHRRESDQQVASKWERFTVELEYGIQDDDRPDPPVGSTEPVRAAYLALDLVAPAAAPAAANLYLATVPLGALAAIWKDPATGPQDASKDWVRQWGEAIERWNDARQDFVDAVRLDLDVNVASSVTARR